MKEMTTPPGAIWKSKCCGKNVTGEEVAVLDVGKILAMRCSKCGLPVNSNKNT